MLESRRLLAVSAYLAHVGGATAVSHSRSSPADPGAFRQRTIERMAGQTSSSSSLVAD